MCEFYKLSTEETVEKLNSKLDGLTEEEAKERACFKNF